MVLYTYLNNICVAQDRLITWWESSVEIQGKDAVILLLKVRPFNGPFT